MRNPYFGILSLSLVMFSAPANAHCYSHWYYPWKQNCERGEIGRHMGLKIPQREAMRVQAPPLAPDDDNDHSWYVEITKIPPDLERDAAIDKLKTIMNK